MKEKKHTIPYNDYKVMHSMEQKAFIKDLNKNINKKLENFDSKDSFRKNLLENWKPGITLGVITIPLSISMGVACGATPSSSIISTIIPGLIMGFMAGSEYTMLGPTPAISATLQACCVKYGMSSLPFISVASGLLSYLITYFKLEKYIDLFPLCVIEGFTNGTALAMIIGQINNALGILKHPYQEISRTIENNSTTSYLQKTDIWLPKSIWNNSNFINRNFSSQFYVRKLLNMEGKIIYKLSPMNSNFNIFNNTLEANVLNNMKFKRFLNQFDTIKNFTSLPEADLTNEESEINVLNKLVDSFSFIKNAKLSCFLVFLITFHSLYLLLKYYPEKPWMIISSIAGILIGFFLKGKIDTLHSKFGNLTLNLFDISYLQEKGFYFFFNLHMLIESITIAFIISLGTLINAKAADSITNTRFNKQKEITALSLSNVLTGIFGGFPVAGLPARTILNIKSGCTNKISNMYCSFVILLICLLILQYMSFLPLSVIAGQVVVTAIRMINFNALENFYIKDKNCFYNTILVGFVCCLKDPITAIGLGLFYYCVEFCEQLSIPWAEIIYKEQNCNLSRLNSLRKSFKIKKNDLISKTNSDRDLNLHENKRKNNTLKIDNLDKENSGIKSYEDGESNEPFNLKSKKNLEYEYFLESNIHDNFIKNNFQENNEFYDTFNTNFNYSNNFYKNDDFIGRNNQDNLMNDVPKIKNKEIYKNKTKLDFRGDFLKFRENISSTKNGESSLDKNSLNNTDKYFLPNDLKDKESLNIDNINKDSKIYLEKFNIINKNIENNNNVKENEILENINKQNNIPYTEAYLPNKDIDLNLGRNFESKNHIHKNEEYHDLVSEDKKKYVIKNYKINHQINYFSTN